MLKYWSHNSNRGKISTPQTPSRSISLVGLSSVLVLILCPGDGGDTERGSTDLVLDTHKKFFRPCFQIVKSHKSLDSELLFLAYQKVKCYHNTEA